ncbi:MAG TPA: LEA type 2 family protein [Candidatus Brocadiia bacterium]|nr:LEA type 2 family protein [Candidatus Brocadiia bacterium]
MILSATKGGLGRSELVIFAIIASILTGCQSLQSLMDTSARPSASVKNVALNDLSLQRATLLFDVEIANPYAVPLPLLDMEYWLASADKQFLSGKAQIGGTVPAHGSRVVSLPATVVFAELIKAISGVKPGAVIPYTARLNLSVDAPAVGVLSLPMEKTGDLPVPTVPEVELTSVQWKALSMSEAKAVLAVKIKNTNDFPVDLSRMSFALSLGEANVVSSSVAQPISFAGGAEAAMELPISFSPLSFGIGVFNMLKGKGSSYKLAGNLDLVTPFGPLSMPYSQQGKTTFR